MQLRSGRVVQPRGVPDWEWAGECSAPRELWENFTCDPHEIVLCAVGAITLSLYGALSVAVLGMWLQ